MFMPPLLALPLIVYNVMALFGFADGAAWLSPLATMQLTGAMVFVIGGYIASVAAMRVGEIGFVAPFRYTSLLVALVLGYLVFGDWPNALTLWGAAIVVATGMFTLLRERQLRRRAARTA